MNNIQNLAGIHTRTTNHSLIPYDPENRYEFEFMRIPIPQSNNDKARLFVGCGCDSQNVNSSYINCVITIQHSVNITQKQIVLFDSIISFNNKEPSAGGEIEEPQYVAYYLYDSFVDGSILPKHWDVKSSNMNMKFHVSSENPQMGFFAGKFKTHDTRHILKITETKYEYDIKTDRYITLP